MLTRRLIEHAKDVARFAPVRPAVKAGLRAAIATILPVLVASAFQLSGAIWLTEQVLEDLAGAVAEGRPPVPLPDFTGLLGEGGPSHGDAVVSAVEEPLLRVQLERVVRQLTVLHGAASRRATPATTSSGAAA